jgi:hypothetical protein
MLNSVLRGLLTLIVAWFLAVIIDRVMTKATAVVLNVFRNRKTAPATK